MLTDSVVTNEDYARRAVELAFDDIDFRFVPKKSLLREFIGDSLF